MVSEYHPVTGWSDPEIKPYGPFMLDPVSSCFQYSTNLFEGMKVRHVSIGSERNLVKLNSILGLYWR